MSFHSAPAVPSPAPQGSGVSCYLRVGKRNASFTLFFSAAMQERLFGGPIGNRQFILQVGRGPDEGKMRVSWLGESEVFDGPMFTASSAVRGGGATIKCGVWDLLPKDKRPASNVELLTYDDASCTLKLPSWARPGARDGQMGQEFALKPVPRASGVGAPASDKQTRLTEQAAALGRVTGK